MLTRIGDWRVHYDLVGSREAPVVLLIHALMTDTSLWNEQVPPLLRAGYRVLRLDLPGHGGSGPRPGSTSMAALADDVASLLDQLGLESAHIVGLSIGGMIAQALAIRHPGRVQSLFLSDTSCAVPLSARDMWASRLETVDAAGSLEPLADATMARVLTPAFKTREPETWQGLRDTIVGVLPLGLRQCAEALQEFNVFDLLPGVKCPAAVLCGDGDVATPPSEAQRIADRIPGARYIEIPEALHYPNVERGAHFNELLIGWLQSRLSETWAA